MKLIMDDHSFCLGQEFFNFSQFLNSTCPQFTSCFLDTFPSWSVAAVISATTPYQIYTFLDNSKHLSATRRIRWSKSNVSRLIALSIVLIVNGIRFLYDFYSFIFPNIWYTPSLARLLSSILNIISFSLLTIVLLLHRKHGVHTSISVFVATLVAALVSLPSLYTHLTSIIMNHYNPIKDQYKSGSLTSYPLFDGLLDIIQSSTLIYLFVSTFWADKFFQDKNSLTKPLLDKTKIVRYSDMKQKKVSPIETCSFFSLITFSFIGKLMSKGYRNRLTLDDMLELRKQESNKYLHEKWKEKYSKNRAVFRTIISSPFFYNSILLRFTVDVLKFVKPQILKLFLGFFESGATYPIWNGYALAASFFVTSTLQSLFLNNYFFVMFLLAIRVRSSLSSIIYEHSLKLTNDERMKTTSGEIINLVSVDTQRLANFLPDFHLIWSCPLQVILGLFFLYIELGNAVFAGVAVLIILIPINFYISKYQQNKETEQMIKKDERIKVINEVLNGIKVIKFYGWEIPFIQKITKIRAEEIEKLRAIAITLAINSFVWSCAPIAVSFSAFAAYVSNNSNVLTVQKAFVSLALFEGLRFPMAEISAVLTDFATRMISVKRLDKFFNETEQINDYVERKVINNGKDSILIKNASLTWKNDASNPDLKNINLRVEKGTLVAIVGNVAMGKSSLLSAILGNMKLISGEISIDSESRIAYVAQQAWIQNATVRDNILFGQAYNPRRYKKVLNICSLLPDLRILPGGDLTEIGEKGINLSGGQKQRVAMARACYSDSDLIFFDDPLSAVDAHVGKSIFENVLSSKTGFLNRQTRVLVTNNIHFLPNVDKIIVISNGTITNVGTYDQLVANGNDFSEFLQEYSSDSVVETIPEHHEINLGSKSPKIGYLRAFSTESNHETEINPTFDQLIDEEKLEVGQVKLKVFMKYLKAFTFFWLICMLLSYILMQIAQVGSGLWLAFWSQNSDPSNNSPAKNEHSQLYYLEGYAIIGFIQVSFSIISMASLVCGVIKTSATFHHILLWSIMRSPISFFDTTPIGRILNRFSKDIESIDSEIGGIIDGYIFCLLHVISTVGLIVYKLPLFSVFIIPIAIIYHFVTRYFVATSRQLQRFESIYKSPIYSHFSESLSGMTTIRAFKAEKRFIDEMSKRTDANARCYLPLVVCNRWLSLRMELIGSSILLIVTVFIIIFHQKFNAVPGLIGILVTYSMYFTDNLNWMTRLIAEMETEIVSVERIQEFSEIVPEKAWTRTKNDSPTIEDKWPEGSIVFENYSLRYRECHDLVLKNLNLKINPGEKIGIVGRTGAGKSSLTLALFRIVEAASGRILLDGIDINQIGLHELRSRLSIIPQDPILFSGTIRSNLDPFSSYSDETLWKALEHSHLKDFVTSSEGGLEYVVSENGENLSVGQRQLICLARALLRHTKILILDEATASVDLETDSLIQNTIRREFVGCTILTIAHRLHTILDYDRVLVLDQGRLLEFDSPKKLLENPESQFYALAKDAGIA